MDERTIELFRVSAKLLDISREAHEAADRIRHKLKELDIENREVLRRSELSVKQSIAITRLSQTKSALKTKEPFQ